MGRITQVVCEICGSTQCEGQLYVYEHIDSYGHNITPGKRIIICESDSDLKMRRGQLVSRQIVGHGHESYIVVTPLPDGVDYMSIPLIQHIPIPE